MAIVLKHLKAFRQVRGRSLSPGHLEIPMPFQTDGGAGPVLCRSSHHSSRHSASSSCFSFFFFFFALETYETIRVIIRMMTSPHARFKERHTQVPHLGLRLLHFYFLVLFLLLLHALWRRRAGRCRSFSVAVDRLPLPLWSTRSRLVYMIWTIRAHL